MEPKNFCFPVLLLFLIPFGVFSEEVCPDTARPFRPNSAYDINRRLALSYLLSNVTPQGGFYSTSVGQEPDKVYAAGMCIQGAEAEDCSRCIKAASDGILRNCLNQTDAFSWPDSLTLCLVRYSNLSFLGSLDLEPSLTVYDLGDLGRNLTKFDRVWEELALRMIAAASSGGNNVSPPKRNYYAADAASFKTFQSIYALMQCTPDISPGNCSACLRQSVRDYRSCCRGSLGGIVERPSCYFRWNLYPYFGAFNNITLAPPSPSQASMAPSPGDAANTTKKGKAVSNGSIMLIAIPTVVVILLLLALGSLVRYRNKSHRATQRQTGDDIETMHSLQFDFKEIKAATDKFSGSSMLGRGGFGEVYKGKLSNGTEVAVKRLVKTSGQGAQEFKNEAVLVAKLQHRNLARLLGFCVEGEEKILVYEFVPNGSLDYFLFDSTKQGELDWRRRYKIIGGIARGILYLHQDSRLTIIHRDLKASNILLDADMNPKISDFGMARIFGMDQTRALTDRIVGTHGYMPPEYAMHGRFSMKTDVYSFGVLLLEIVSGKMSSSFYQKDGSAMTLVTHAWRLWRNGSPLELVDQSLGDKYESDEVIRCINIALLCVQEDPADRPTLPTIILILTRKRINVPEHQKPGFFFQSSRDEVTVASSSGSSVPCSVDDASITHLYPR